MDIGYFTDTLGILQEYSIYNGMQMQMYMEYIISLYIPINLGTAMSYIDWCFMPPTNRVKLGRVDPIALLSMILKNMGNMGTQQIWLGLAA